MSTAAHHRPAAPIPARAGIGLRAPHYRALLHERPALGWLEVHSENYFGGGQPLGYLEQIRAHYPVSLHGVGLSLGSTDTLNRGHLRKLKTLIERIDPGFVSEHLCWNAVNRRHVPDLLPLPYTAEVLNHLCARIDAVQQFIGRSILIENISSYIHIPHADMSEAQFISELARRSGCGVLLDINNVYVNARNNGGAVVELIDTLPLHAVRELHLAGFDVRENLLVDTHGARVAPEVWDLYRYALRRFGALPTLIEWDTDIPALEVLLSEAATAQTLLDDVNARAA